MQGPAETREGEVRLPGKLFAVIADDERNYAEGLQRSLIYLDQDYKSFIVDGPQQLVQTAMTGNGGDQADIAFLDDNYVPAVDWSPDEDIFNEIVKKVPQLADHSVPFDLWVPRSTSFAIILRLLGFEGKIVSYSGAPPEPDEIQSLVDSVNTSLETQLSSVVDGSIRKMSFTSAFMVPRHATSQTEKGSWDWNDDAQPYQAVEGILAAFADDIEARQREHEAQTT